MPLTANQIAPEGQGSDFYLSSIRAVLKNWAELGQGVDIPPLANIPNQGTAANLRDIAGFLAAIAQTQPSGGGAGLASASGLVIPGDATLVEIAPQTSAGAETLTLYTAPAGKRAYIPHVAYKNPTGGSINAYASVRISGTNYRISPVGPIASTVSSVSPSHGFLLNPGESLMVTLDATGLIIRPAAALVWDSTDADGPKRETLTTIGSGNNLLFTAPARGAMVLGAVNGMQIWLPSFAFLQSSGGSINYAFHTLNVGETASASTRVATLAAAASDALVQTQFSNAVLRLAPGQSVVLETSGAVAPAIAWMIWQPVTAA